MHALLLAVAFASALSAIFAFRFRPRRRALLIYFVLFASLEGLVHTFLIPEGAVPIEAAFVLFGIAAIFGGLVQLQKKLEADDS